VQYRLSWGEDGWFTGINHRVAERDEDERRRRTINQRQICCSFQVLVIREIARLCELCVSAVNIRSLIIKTQVFESAKSFLCILCAFVVQFFWGKNDESELTTTLTTNTHDPQDRDHTSKMKTVIKPECHL